MKSSPFQKSRRNRERRRFLFESLEARHLMAGLENVTQGPVTGSTAPYVQTHLEYVYDQLIEQAFIRESDLSKYTTEQLRSASQWVLHVTPNTTVNYLGDRLGLGTLAIEPLIHNTYVYQVPASVDREEVGKMLQGIVGVKYAYPLVPRGAVKKFIPNDTLFNAQWHLRNTSQTGGTAGADANVETAWDTSRGSGVVIGIVDDGVQYTHPDLDGKYRANLSIDVRDNDNDPAPNPATDDSHGTAVAGVAAAETNNGLGVAGAAPDAELAAIRLIGGASADDQMEATALSHQAQEIDIYNNSWGAPDDGTLLAAGPLATAAILQGTTSGRNNLGNIYTWAAGNGLIEGDNANYDGYANLPNVFAIGALSHGGRQSVTSEPGDNILVSTYGTYDRGGEPGIVTTDLTGTDGINFAPGFSADDDPLLDLNYTSIFGGTSSATPLASGVIALMLQVNPNLTWRDVRAIIAQTAEKNDATDADWQTNGAGHLVSHKYGFGSLDAAAAVATAATWTNVPAQIAASSPMVNPGLSIPDANPTGVSATVNVTEDITIETVSIFVDLPHLFPEDLEIVLISPDGTRSVLAEPHPILSPFTDFLDGWTFNSLHHWGESSQGTWRIEVRDLVALDVGTLNSFRLDFFGTDPATTPLLGTVRGIVFDDIDSSGTQNAGEGGLNGITVFVDTNNNGVLDSGERSTVTAGNGDYTFANLQPGNYTFDIVVPATNTQTFPAGAGNYTVAVTGNTVISNQNFGVHAPVPGQNSHILTNQPGDGTVRVGVDGFGSFGSAAGLFAADAVYDPVGSIGAAGTTFESGVALGLGGQRVMLSTGIDGSSLANPAISGDNTVANSSFSLQGLNFQLVQRLEPLLDRNGAQVGTRLTQTYTITNPSASQIDFDLVRYLDGDLDFDGSLIDGGGRLVIGSTEILFETDTAAGTADSTTFVGITADGGSTAGNRYEIDSYSGLLNRITSGGMPDNIVTGDGGDADEFIDAGQGYDVTLALRNIFSLAAGGTVTYTTSTLFGSGAPETILPPPPPPFQATGVVFNDLNGNLVQDSNEPGIPNVIVYVDNNNDGQIGLGEYAQVTNSRGQYGFFLPAGVHTIRQADLPGYALLAPASRTYTVNGDSGEVVGGLAFANAGQFDYGDAPFQSTIAQGGPVHGILADFYMGSGVDGEANGQPSQLANGDDLNGNDDDDGVVFVTPLARGQTASIDVTIHNGNRASGLFHGWIDFNRDGDWDDAGERIFSNQHVNNGVNRLTFQVPAGAVLGNTYARFRYGYGHSVGPAGFMVAGEVEDYLVGVVGPVPVANPDVFNVKQNSTNNAFDVLFNDIASVRGPLTIIGVSGGSLGGVATINSGKTLNYTPKNGVFGTEIFSYTVSDGGGGISTAMVTVHIEQVINPPIAVDDTFRVTAGSFSNVLNVTANDLGGPFTSLIVPATTSAGGTLSVHPVTRVLTYTPATSFVGLDQFSYTIRDARGLESTGRATVHVGNDTADDTASIELRITNELGVAIDEVALGQEFQLRVFVRDQRVSPVDPGVLAAYLDVLYNTGLVDVKGATNAHGFEVTFGSAFGLFPQGVASPDGILNEIGAARDTIPTDSGPHLLMTITFIAQAIGVANFIGDPADIHPAHDIVMFSPPSVVPIDKVTYGFDSVNIVTTVGPRFQNSGNIHDVNGDGVVSPQDALLVILELNAGRGASVAGKSPSAVQPLYFDVSGDDIVTALDALLVINYLNRGGQGEAASEPISVSADPALAIPSAPQPLLPDQGAVESAFVDDDAAGVLQSLPAPQRRPLPSLPASFHSPDDDDFVSFGGADDDDLLDLFIDVADAWRK